MSSKLMSAYMLAVVAGDAWVSAIPISLPPSFEAGRLLFLLLKSFADAAGLIKSSRQTLPRPASSGQALSVVEWDKTICHHL